MPEPKPGDACAVESAVLHSAGAVVNALHIATFTASGERLALTIAPFITSVGEPETPYFWLSAAYTGYEVPESLNPNAV